MVRLHRPCQAILRALQVGLGFPSDDLWLHCIGKWGVLGLGMAGAPHPTSAHHACHGEQPIRIRDLFSPNTTVTANAHLLTYPP